MVIRTAAASALVVGGLLLFGAAPASATPTPCPDTVGFFQQTFNCYTQFPQTTATNWANLPQQTITNWANLPSTTVKNLFGH